MTVASFTDLSEHVGHDVEVVTYGDPAVNVAIECNDCSVVLLDFDNPDPWPRRLGGVVIDEITRGSARTIADVLRITNERQYVDQALDRCSYCGVIVDRDSPEGEQLGQYHDNGECCVSPVEKWLLRAVWLIPAAIVVFIIILLVTA